MPEGAVYMFEALDGSVSWDSMQSVLSPQQDAPQCRRILFALQLRLKSGQYSTVLNTFTILHIYSLNAGAQLRELLVCDHLLSAFRDIQKGRSNTLAAALAQLLCDWNYLFGDTSLGRKYNDVYQAILPRAAPHIRSSPQAEQYLLDPPDPHTSFRTPLLRGFNFLLFDRKHREAAPAHVPAQQSTAAQPPAQVVTPPGTAPVLPTTNECPEASKAPVHECATQPPPQVRTQATAPDLTTTNEGSNASNAPNVLTAKSPNARTARGVPTTMCPKATTAPNLRATTECPKAPTASTVPTTNCPKAALHCTADTRATGDSQAPTQVWTPSLMTCSLASAENHLVKTNSDLEAEISSLKSKLAQTEHELSESQLHARKLEKRLQLEMNCNFPKTALQCTSDDPATDGSQSVPEGGGHSGGAHQLVGASRQNLCSDFWLLRPLHVVVESLARCGEKVKQCTTAIAKGAN